MTRAGVSSCSGFAGCCRSRSRDCSNTSGPDRPCRRWYRMVPGRGLARHGRRMGGGSADAMGCAYHREGIGLGRAIDSIRRELIRRPWRGSVANAWPAFARHFNTGGGSPPPAYVGGSASCRHTACGIPTTVPIVRSGLLGPRAAGRCSRSSLCSRIMAWATAVGSSGLTSRPVSPFFTNSGTADARR